MQTSMRLKYEPSSEPLHISVKQLFLNCSPSLGLTDFCFFFFHTLGLEMSDTKVYEP